MNKILGKSKIIVLFIFFAVIFYFGIAPMIINSQKYQSQIRKILVKSLDNPVSLGQIHSNLTWDLGLKINIDKVAIYHKDGSDFVTSGPLSFEISLPYLVKKKFKIKKIWAKNPVFITKRLKNGHFDIEELFSNRYRVIFDNTRIEASDYKIFFRDEFLHQAKSFLISGENIKISNFDPVKSFKINMDGSILTANRPSTVFAFEYFCNLPLNKKQLLKNNLSIKGRVENFYLDMYLPYLQRYFSDYSSLLGVMNADFDINLRKSDFWADDFKFNIQTRNFRAKKQENADVLRALGLLKIDVFAKRKRGKLILKKLTVNSPDVNIKLKGNIGAVDSNNPKLNLGLFVKNSKVEAISYLFPEEIKVPYDVFHYFRQFDFKSIADGYVDIQGTSQKPTLFGDLKFKGFSLIRNAQRISDGTLNVNFDGKVYNIDAKVWAKPSQPLYVQGSVAPQLHKINLGVWAGKIELGPTQQFLFAIRDIFKFNLGVFVSSSVLDGIGDGHICIYGDMLAPYLEGYLNFSDCKLDYSGLSQPFEHVVGRVLFHEDDVYFDNLKSFIAKSPLFTNGKIIKTKIHLVFDSPKLNAFETRKMINESRDLALTKSRITDMEAISGYAIARLIFGGDVKKKLLFEEFNLDILGGEVTYKEVGFPIKLIAGKILINDKGTFSNGIKSEILGASSMITGSVLAENDMVIPNYIVSIKGFQSEKIKQIMASPMLSEKDKEMIAKLKNGKGTFDVDFGFFPLETVANFRFHDTSYMYESLNLPIKFQSGRLFITPKKAKFESVIATVADSLFYFNGSVNDYQQAPFFDNFILDIPKNTSIKFLNQILSNTSKKELFESGSFGGNIKLQGPVSSLNSFGNIDFKDILSGNVLINQASLTLDDNGLNFPNFDVNVAGQKFHMSAILDKKFSPPFKINKIQIAAHKFDIGKFMASLSKNSLPFNLPFVVENGAVCFDKLIWKNLLATNFSSSISLDENSLCKLSGMQFQALNGFSKGNISYNLRDTKLSGDLSVRDVPIGSLAPFFRTSPNDVSGDFCCNAEFCTQGHNQSEILNNTKARVNFNITDGHFEKLRKVEHLLMAQSILLGGVGNISPNAILDLLFPANLGSFKTFSGTVIAKDGSLMSDNLCSKGENLSIQASGNLAMGNKRSDAIILGKLPEEETKRLGILGDISIGAFLGFIPGIGFLPDSAKILSVVTLLPFFDKLSFLNNKCTDKPSSKYKKFVARMLKTSHSRISLGSFEWFDKLSEREKCSFPLIK